MLRLRIFLVFLNIKYKSNIDSDIKTTPDSSIPTKIDKPIVFLKKNNRKQVANIFITTFIL